MPPQSLKQWHWTLLGSLAGLLLGYAQVGNRLGEPVGGDGFISQATFERELRLSPVSGIARLKNITVCPPDRGIEIVRMQRLAHAPNAAQSTYADAKFAAPVPFQTTTGADAGKSYRSVTDYIAQLARANPHIQPRYAWWQETSVTIALWTLSGAVLLGAFWPPVLRLLVGAGFGQPPQQTQFDLSLFNVHPTPSTSPNLPLFDDSSLREIEAAVLQNLRSQDPPHLSPSSPDTPHPAPVRPLIAPPLQAMLQPPEQEKHYQGEYYPVARTTAETAHPHPVHQHSSQPQRSSTTPMPPPTPHLDHKLPGQHTPSDSAPHAFTLVELLVVLGIITTLVSILMPALRLARQSAQQIQCASQLRQLGAALYLYADLNKGWLPAWSGWHTYPDGSSSEDEIGLAWTERLAPHFVPPDHRVYNCPSFPDPTPRRNYFLAAQWAGKNQHQAMKLADIKTTSRFVLSGDKTQRSLYPPPFGTSNHLCDDADPDDFGGGDPILAWPWQQGGFWMHRGGNNVLFDDSHVALFPAFDRTAMTFHPTKMLDWSEIAPDP